MEKATATEQMYYILGCTQAKAWELSKEIDVPIDQCRDFLLNQVIKFLRTNTTSISIEDLVTYGMITR